MTNSTDGARVVVIGAGPGGYAAAFHAADLGMDVTLVDVEAEPGGVCLYRGCIPSKALLHVAALLRETRDAEAWGVHFGAPEIDLDALRGWKEQMVKKLTSGLGQLARQRKLTLVRGRARFRNAHSIEVTSVDGDADMDRTIEFDHAIVATGSRPTVIPGLDLDSPRVMDSTAALALDGVPDSLLVIGGGYIGLELGSVYAALGSRVTVVEMTSGLLPGADRDLVEPLARRLRSEFEEILLDTRVIEMQEATDGVRVTLAGLNLAQPQRTFDRALVAVGRMPNSQGLGFEQTGVEVDSRGFIKTDEQRRTGEPSIFAIGDVVGEPMLAHKATHEGLVAVEVIAGRPAVFAPLAIPAVVFTDPEIAWCGLTETAALSRGIPFEIARFPWAASGRATTLGRNDGLTKLLIDPQTERVLGVGIVGQGAGELIGEGLLAVEMGARADDLRRSVHAHPTLAETLMEAAELFFGPATHYLPRRKR